MKKFADAGTKDQFSLQMPYLNQNGNARCIDIPYHSAHQLIEAGSHTAICAGWIDQKKDQAYFVITPKVPAATGVVFQVGRPAL